MKFLTFLLLLATVLILHRISSIYASIPCIFDPIKVQWDKQLEEFLRGKIHCQNFINQDLTFLQLSVIHATPPKEDSILPEKNTIAIPPTATQENNLPQEQNENSPQVLPAEVLYDRGQANNTTAPIQPVEPVVGLTPQEQCRKEDPDLTLAELLGLIPCEEHITTPLQTLDGLYVVRRRGRLPPRQPLSVCALLPAYEGNRHLRPLGNLGHRLRRPRWID